MQYSSFQEALDDYLAAINQLIAHAQRQIRREGYSMWLPSEREAMPHPLRATLAAAWATIAQVCREAHGQARRWLLRRILLWAQTQLDQWEHADPAPLADEEGVIIIDAVYTVVKD